MFSLNKRRNRPGRYPFSLIPFAVFYDHFRNHQRDQFVGADLSAVGCQADHIVGLIEGQLLHSTLRAFAGLHTGRDIPVLNNTARDVVAILIFP
ncbi:hypothetical protein D3C84_1126680 [compost metagenome]